MNLVFIFYNVWLLWSKSLLWGLGEESWLKYMLHGSTKTRDWIPRTHLNARWMCPATGHSSIRKAEMGYPKQDGWPDYPEALACPSAEGLYFSRNSRQEHKAETMKEQCFLTCSLWLAQLPSFPQPRSTWLRMTPSTEATTDCSINLQSRKCPHRHAHRQIVTQLRFLLPKCVKLATEALTLYQQGLLNLWCSAWLDQVRSIVILHMTGSN